MNNTKHRSLTLVCLLMTSLALSACSGTKSHQVREISKQDKRMDCGTLKLEMAETEFLRDKAEQNKEVGLSVIFKPLSYPSTIISANKALKSADNRLNYLSRLYNVRRCDSQQYVSKMPEQASYEPTSGSNWQYDSLFSE